MLRNVSKSKLLRNRQFSVGREVKNYEKPSQLLPNFSANFSKKFLDGNTSFLAEIKHDYTEKEWSNVSEENMTALMNLRYKMTDQLRNAG